MISGRSKKLDQLYVSKAEYKKYDPKKKKMIKDRAVDSVISFDKTYSYWLGGPAFRRLVKSAKRKKLSTIAYYQKYLA